DGLDHAGGHSHDVGFTKPSSGEGPCNLAIHECLTHTRHMLNIASILVGIVALVLAIPSTIPFLGWGNWFVLPIAVVGIGLGALSRSNGGRNFCLIVFAIAVVRLMLGGGFI